MMKILLLPALLLLAACGSGVGGGQSFMVEVDRPAHEVAADLSALDADSQSDIAVHNTQIFRSQEDSYSLDFRLVAPKENEHQFQSAEANFKFRLESLDGGRTRIAVTLDVPPVELYPASENMVLSEAKVAKQLRLALDNYAVAVSAGGETGQAIASIDFLFTAVAFSMDQASMKNLATSQYGAADFSELVDGGSYGSGDGEDPYSYEPEYGAPTDTTAPAADAAPATDTAYTTDTAYEGDGGWAAE